MPGELRETGDERLCPRCGENWPRLTPHTCPHPVAEDPESLVALLWDVLHDVPLTIGELSISVQVSAMIVRPLARELVLRQEELLAALREADA